MNMENSESNAIIHSQSVPAFKHLQTGNGSVTEISFNRSQSDSGWKVAWKGAVIKAKEAKDPWAKYEISESYETEKALRYRYNALEKKWVRDEIEIKMQQKSFARGAMRKCFRMKKLSQFSHSKDWKHAANYVAKCYIEDVANKTYFDDVKLQMDAKVWAEEFNRQNPPKKVDIFQVYIIELVERDSAQLFHVEHFIEGNYVKYNSNSGFVLRDENFRMTPQAFSHFTFERSGHQLIVVDVQGVGDLYTDPQIHTACSTGYGEANLGAKGMALFFASHKCNKICKELGLASFDLSPLEERRLDDMLSSSQPSTKLRETYYIGKRKMSAIFDLVEKLSSSGYSSDASSIPESPRWSQSTDDFNDGEPSGILSESLPSNSSLQEGKPARNLHQSINSMKLQKTRDFFVSLKDNDPSDLASFFAKFNLKRSCIDGNNLLDENEVKAKDHKHCIVSQPIVVDDVFEEDRSKAIHTDLDLLQDTMLGMVHLELALFNQIGRFTENEADMDSALFHLEHAASSDSIEANQALAKIYLQLPHDILENFIAEENEFNYNKGIAYLLNAANKGDRESMLLAANLFYSGERLGSRDRSWTEAIHWYEKALEISESDFDGLSENPHHKVYARMAEMYQKGGFGLERDPNRSGELYNDAGESAMNVMQGKLANKYYMLAEEVWAEVDE